MWKILILQQQSNKKKKRFQFADLCSGLQLRSRSERALLRPVMELLACKLSFLWMCERILRVEDVMVALHPGAAAAVCRRPLWRHVMMSVTQAERKEAVESRAVDH